jgi:hypothetical protein
MSHELSKRHQEQIAEKAAIIANTAFGLGRTAERNRIIELLKDELSEEQHNHLATLITGEETNAGSN